MAQGESTQDNQQQQPQSPEDRHVKYAMIGMDMDSTLLNIQQGKTTYALNATVANFDGQQVSYQNEMGNSPCITFPTGYKVMRAYSIYELNVIYYWLAAIDGSNSQIGYSYIGQCTYYTYIQGPCLNLSVNYPIHAVEHEVINDVLRVYWADGLNPRRFFDTSKFPWQTIGSGCEIQNLTGIDCNKLNIQPAFKVPLVTIDSVSDGGQLVEGTYQFAIQYSDAISTGYTAYYSVSNPVPIWQNFVTLDFNLQTGKSIKLRLNNLDTDFYRYFNLAVVKTINGVSSVDLAGTYPTSDQEVIINYTGASKSPIALNIDDIFLKYPVYDTAQGVMQTDKILVWYGLTEEERISYQQIASKIKVGWQTYQLPYKDGYSEGENTSNLKGYMRNEVYPLEICFIVNGKQTDGFHIPGRVAVPDDLVLVDNPMYDSTDTCDTTTPHAVPKWKALNTAVNHGPVANYTGAGANCYEGLFEYGEFAYWESEELYPCNELIWGDLAGKPIRHHKFPDNAITHNHDNYGNIFPIGLNIDPIQIQQLISDSDLTPTQKSKITGFKILRGNRADNKSVVAKGLLYNIGKYSKDSTTYYYPNYPYNDVRPDPFITTSQTQDHSDSGSNTLLGAEIGFAAGGIPGAIVGGIIGNNSPSNSPQNQNIWLDGFSSTDSRSRFTFHSPDTHFYQPFLGNQLKLETVEYGQSSGHFIQVKDHPRYKLLSGAAYPIAVGIAEALTAAGASTSGNIPVIGNLLGGSGSFTPWDQTLAQIQEILDLFDKLIPWKNFAYQYNSVGEYNSFRSLPSTQQTLFNLPIAQYIVSGLQSAGDTYQINNYLRESSVYLKTSDNLPFTHELYPDVQDTSRVIDSQVGCGTNTFSEPISSFYASINRYLPGQYGQIYSYETIDTGYYFDIPSDSSNSILPNLVMGGDIFISRFALKIKQSFFTENLVGGQDGNGLDFRNFGNIGYPNYWISNDNSGPLSTAGLAGKLLEVAGGAIAGAVAGGLGTETISGAIAGGAAGAVLTGLVTLLGSAVNNFDCRDGKVLYQDGKFYLFAYGIPYFYVESEVNVDYRQAYNSKEGDFYPHVSSGIPDNWLQEINVPIVYDNTYTYNSTLSKQNKENLFTHLPEDFTLREQNVYNYRAIYSVEQSNAVNFKVNNWLIYPPSNYYDFPQNYGKLIAIDESDDRAVTVRFENRTQIYNTYVTIDTSNPQVAYLGNSKFLGAFPPVDLMVTDLGYAASQNKMMLKTEYGKMFCDARKGQVFLLPLKIYSYMRVIPRDIGAGISKFLTNELNFKILKQFPTYPIDNHYNGVGIHGVYDSLLNRAIITKLDYEPIVSGIIYSNGQFTYNGQVIALGDPNYFCNRSFTISYDFKNQSWISFHSYLPNFYIGEANYFYSGLNSSSPSTWIHNTDPTLYNNYYGAIQPYILEYPFQYKDNDEILQAIKDYTTVYRYDTDDNIVTTDSDYFNKSILYTPQQSSGILNLVPKPKNNLQSYMTYPIYNSDSKTIVFTKSDSYYQYNTFWSLVADNTKPLFIKSCQSLSTDKVVNQANMDYSKRSYKKAPLRAKQLKVRHILDNSSSFKLVSQFIIAGNQISYK